MAKGSIMWAPNFVLSMTEEEALAVAEVLGSCALEGDLNDDALGVWQRLSAMTIEANEMRRGD